jgi:uncharacterized protein (DUF488 family)
MARPHATPPTVLTIGHSARSLEEFVDLLKAHAVKCVVDVRKMPRSRHNPQFNQETLSAALDQADIRYIAMPGLGGLRRRLPDSPNAGWRNKSFQGYADYMQTHEFGDAIEQLIRLARKYRVAVMCAEAVPWRCHRSLIADALTVRGIPVEDIMSASRRTPHRLTQWARVEGTCITYPPEAAEGTNARGGGPARRLRE